MSAPITNYTLAQLQARADGQNFVLTLTSPTLLVQGTDPLQRFWTPPAGSPATLIMWTARYRGRLQTGPTLVVATALVAYAQQYVLNSAWTFLDAVDLRLNLVGRDTATMGDPLQGQPVPSPVNSPR